MSRHSLLFPVTCSASTNISWSFWDTLLFQHMMSAALFSFLPAWNAGPWHDFHEAGVHHWIVISPRNQKYSEANAGTWALSPNHPFMTNCRKHISISYLSVASQIRFWRHSMTHKYFVTRTWLSILSPGSTSALTSGKACDNVSASTRFFPSTYVTLRLCTPVTSSSLSVDALGPSPRFPWVLNEVAYCQGVPPPPVHRCIDETSPQGRQWPRSLFLFAHTCVK